tara:strand:+ start:583 stop:720 length:138 start_codon:yes stop_codon:yes gene_type:complete
MFPFQLVKLPFNGGEGSDKPDFNDSFELFILVAQDVISATNNADS